MKEIPETENPDVYPYSGAVRGKHDLDRVGHITTLTSLYEAINMILTLPEGKLVSLSEDGVLTWVVTAWDII